MNTKNIFLVVFLCMAFVGCEDFLIEDPKDFLSPDNLPATAADCDLMLVGTMDYQRNQNLYDRHFLMLAGVSADDVDVRYTSGVRYDLDRYTYVSTNESIEKVWQNTYGVINEVNTMIAKIPTTNLNDDVKEKYVAAAKFYRALYYFHLVRLYGNKTVLIDKPVEDFVAATDLEPASIADVYALIKEDIDYAVAAGDIDGHRLPVEEWPTYGRPTYGAALALQAKVYMTMAGHPLNQTDKWQVAHDATSELMGMSRYGLATDVTTMWLLENENSPEFIFSIQNQLPDYGSMLSVQTRPDGWRIFIGNEDYYLKHFETNDLRREAYHILEWDGKTYPQFSGKAPYIGKFVDIGREQLNEFSKRSDSNFPVFRMSEVYLMFAEAENELNGPTQAAHDALNATRVRAGLTALSGLTKEQFKEELIRERARELTFEGKRRFDLHRWGMLDEVLSADPHASTNWNMAEHEYFPAPERDAILNPNLN